MQVSADTGGAVRSTRELVIAIGSWREKHSLGTILLKCGTKPKKEEFTLGAGATLERTIAVGV